NNRADLTDPLRVVVRTHYLSETVDALSQLKHGRGELRPAAIETRASPQSKYRPRHTIVHVRTPFDGRDPAILGQARDLKSKIAEVFVGDIHEFLVSVGIGCARQIASRDACEAHDVNEDRRRRVGENQLRKFSSVRGSMPSWVANQIPTDRRSDTAGEHLGSREDVPHHEFLDPGSE